MIDKKKPIWYGCFIAIVIYCLLVCGFYYVGDNELKFNKINTEMPNIESAIGEITDNTLIEQTFSVDFDIINSITFEAATYARQNTGTWNIKIVNFYNNTVLTEKNIDISTLVDNSGRTIVFDDGLYGIKGEKLILQISSPNSSQGSAATIYYNSNSNKIDRELFINNNRINGELCFSINGSNENFFGTYYWYFALIGFVLLNAYCINIIIKKKNNKITIVELVFGVYSRYSFLIKQLVSRDFKTKYKRSVLGFIWSFLNPLLTMVVQYIVFSTIFRSNINNFPVYLLTGSILFNFFTESVGLGLASIINNAPLITKVYVPKYIYPLTRVLSTGINLLMSLVPLLLAIIVTGENITKAYFLLPFVLACLLLFCIGIALALSTAMVFFRDTQFLWGIISLLWMYATPLFYPESIIPSRFSFILKLNPMYYFVRFARTVVLEGVSPEPMLYLLCIICSLVSLVVGAIIFKKGQDKFILYL